MCQYSFNDQKLNAKHRIIVLFFTVPSTVTTMGCSLIWVEGHFSMQTLESGPWLRIYRTLKFLESALSVLSLSLWITATLLHHRILALLPWVLKAHSEYWSSPTCQNHVLCRSLVSEAIQLLVLNPTEWENLGTLVQHFAEPFLKLTFHAESVFGENRLLHDHSDVLELKMYGLLTEMTNSLFKRDVDIPLHELPILLSPLDISLGLQLTPPFAPP